MLALNKISFKNHMMHYYITVRGVKYHYVQSGKGRLILFLHGFPEFWYSWKKVFPYLEQHFCLVAIDMKGYGDTDRPLQVNAYNYKVIAAEILEIINCLSTEKIYLIGHDWGGGIAWEIAKLYPEKIEKLIVINCPPPSVLLRSIFTNLKQFKMSWYIFFFQLPYIPEWWLHRQLKTFFWRAMKGWSINKAAFEDVDIAQYENAFKERQHFTGPINYYRAAFRSIFDSDFRSFSKIKVSTLIIWADEDRALGKWLLDDIEPYFDSGLEIKHIKNCSHWVQQEQPEEVAFLIQQFIHPKTN